MLQHEVTLSSNPSKIEGWPRIQFHFFSEPQLRRVRAEFEKLSICEGRPAITDVPYGMIIESSERGKKVQGVYNRNNRLVETSLRVKGFGKRSDVADRTTRQHSVDDNRSAYYLGVVNRRYGHFVLETLCRAWAWNEVDDGRIPILQWTRHDRQWPLPDFVFCFLALIPGLSERIELPESPVRFSQVAVPNPAFVFDRQAHKEFKLICERMAGKVALEAATDQPLYLSRTALNSSARRFLVGETRLEHLLEKEGFLIVHPETLPIEDQISLFNKHRWIVSPMGSACHTRLFSRQPNNLIMLARPVFSSNFPLCDYLSEGTAHYINALSSPELGIDVPSIAAPPLLLNEERLLAVLKELGLIRTAATFEGPAPDLDTYKRKWIQIVRSQASGQRNADLERAIDRITATLSNGL